MINSTLIQYLNLKPDSINLLGKNIEKLLDISMGNNFSDMIQKEQGIRAKIDKGNYIKLLCTAKETTAYKGSLLTERKSLQTTYLIRG